MKTRNEFAKLIRRIEIFSLLFMILGAGTSIIMGWGVLGLLIVVVIYLILTAYTYTLMKKCKCEKCGHVEIFEKSHGITVGVLSHCPECNTKLKDNVPVNELNNH